MTSQKSNIPSLRFPEFKGEWKKNRLADLTDIYDGTHQTPDYVEEGVPFYSVEHITANNFQNTKFISEEVYTKESKKVRIEKNDILMTRIGDIGSSKLISWDVRASFYVSLALIKHKNTFNSVFLDDPPPINESGSRVNLGILWTHLRRNRNGSEEIYDGADYRVFASG